MHGVQFSERFNAQFHAVEGVEGQTEVLLTGNILQGTRGRKVTRGRFRMSLKNYK